MRKRGISCRQTYRIFQIARNLLIVLWLRTRLQRSTADLLLLHHHHNLTFFKCVVCANATKNDSPFHDSRVSCFDENTSTIVKRMAVTTTKTDQAAIEANIKKKKEEEERESKKSTQPLPLPPPLPEKPELGDWERMRTMRTGCVLREA
ncbi:hypothetical protein EZV62_006355 [Acer yangbiense]|uniref:Uncharacterized protein n=1 Tax=Acer yangbiense TaxID=1000413 RepID=A0A5C7IQ52_9ROSI|nr:hypothetical protein EZV62_006355 [Acer yangbiense]